MNGLLEKIANNCPAHGNHWTYLQAHSNGSVAVCAVRYGCGCLSSATASGDENKTDNAEPVEARR